MIDGKLSRTPMAALERLIADLGSQAAAARRIGVGRQHITDLLSGRRMISGKVAKALGYKKRVMFEPIDKR